MGPPQTDPNNDRLKSLATFAGPFRDPKIAFGHWGKEPQVGGSYILSEVGSEFCGVVNDFIFSMNEFDWGKWINEPEGKKLSSGLDAIAAADGPQLTKLALTLVRQDRFVDGVLAGAFEDKTLLAIVERAETLIEKNKFVESTRT